MNTRSSTRQEYLKRINLVIEYINNNLDCELELDTLARIANFSSYHFHRILKAFLGESIGMYISRIRVETAAKLIRHTKNSIQDIAYKVGYDAPSSLTKAFSHLYNISPMEYRNDQNFTIISVPQSTATDIKNPKIVTVPDRTVLYIRIIGAYGNEEYAKAWPKLWAVVKTQKLFTAGIEHLGISYDDPSVTESSKCRYDACLVIHKPAMPEGEVGVKELEGGKYAVFLHVGAYENLSGTYDMIFGKWLPESGYELRDVPCFEKYISNPDKTDASKLKTEIFIPLV